MKLSDHIKHRELRVQDGLYLHGLPGGIAQPEQQRMVITARGCDDVSDALHREFRICRHGEYLAKGSSAADFDGRMGRRHLGRMSQQSGDQR
jgi:hypothetical protein